MARVKMVRFRVPVIVALSLLIAGLVACTQPSPPTPATGVTSSPAPAPAPKARVLKWSTFEPATELASIQLKMTAELTEKYTNGALKWEFYPAEQLAKGPDQFEACRDGAIDVVYVSIPYEADTIKLPNINCLPYPPRDFDTMLYAWRQMERAGLDEYYQSFGVKPIGMSLNHKFEVWSTAKWGPIKTLENVKGCKLRVPGGIMGTAQAALGFTPISMPSPEAYMALQTGTLDAVLMHHPIMVALRLHEVTKYAMRTGFVSAGMPMCINLKVWKSLTYEQQLAMLLAARDAENWRYRNMAMWDDTVSKPALKKAGVVSYYLPPDEAARWQAKLAPMWDKFEAENGNEANGLGSKLIRVFREALEI